MGVRAVFCSKEEVNFETDDNKPKIREQQATTKTEEDDYDENSRPTTYNEIKHTHSKVPIDRKPAYSTCLLKIP